MQQLGHFRAEEKTGQENNTGVNGVQHDELVLERPVQGRTS
jgi:hypothetical protein